MKVVHLNTYNSGGAGIAGQRLVNALNSVKPAIATIQTSADATNTTNFSSKFLKLATTTNFVADIAFFALKEANLKYRFAFSPGLFGRDISQSKKVRDADIIHIHWINQGFLSINDLKKLTALGKPIVWTLHDMWAFTGGCHYSGTCDHFKNECGNCYYLNNPNNSDLSHKGWLRKQDFYTTTSKISFVACSNWMAGIAHQSSLLKDFNIEAIPNPVDISLFVPMDKATLRKNRNINPDAHIVLFGAFNILDNRKGISYLIEALNLLKNQIAPNEKIEIVIFGKNKSFNTDLLPFKVHDFSVITSPIELAEIYNLANVFVMPSLEDNLPNMVMEALSCGTPVVAFNNGGVIDMVIHQENGYLADYLSAEDLANGIVWVLNQKDRSRLQLNARKKVENDFSPEIVAKKYIEVYQKLLNTHI